LSGLSNIKSLLSKELEEALILSLEFSAALGVEGF
jgi:hypothetical protein